MPVVGCGAKSDDEKTNGENHSDDEPDDSGEGCASQVEDTPGRSLAEMCDIKLFHASFGHACETLVKATAKSNGVKLTGKLLEC